MKKNVLSFIVLVFSITCTAQNVSINNSGVPADASAMLDISSTAKGMLIPRMTTVQIFAIPNAAAGLLVYNTTTQSFFYRTLTQWQELMVSNNNEWVNTGTYVYNASSLPVVVSNNGASPLNAQLNVTKETTATNTTENIIGITHATNTGIASDGIGAAIIFRNQISVGSVTNTGKISSLIEDVATNTKAMKFDVFDMAGIPVPMLYIKPGNVGIGNTNPDPLAMLDVNGNIRSSNLAGTGLRLVRADVNGFLTASAQTHYLSVPSSAFKAREDINNFTALDANSDCYLGNGSIDIAIAPVYFPDGATVSRITFYFLDNSVSNMAFRLLYSDNNAGSSSLMCFMQTSGAASGYNSILSASVSNALILNQSRTYSLRISAVNGNWTGNNLKIKAVTIEYTL